MGDPKRSDHRIIEIPSSEGGQDRDRSSAPDLGDVGGPRRNNVPPQSPPNPFPGPSSFPRAASGGSAKGSSVSAKAGNFGKPRPSFSLNLDPEEFWVYAMKMVFILFGVFVLFGVSPAAITFFILGETMPFSQPFGPNLVGSLAAIYSKLASNKEVFLGALVLELVATTVQFGSVVMLMKDQRTNWKYGLIIVIISTPLIAIKTNVWSASLGIGWWWAFMGVLALEIILEPIFLRKINKVWK